MRWFEDSGKINAVVKLICPNRPWESPEWEKLAHKAAMLLTSAALLAYLEGDFDWPVLVWDFMGYTVISMFTGFSFYSSIYLISN